MPRKGDLKKLHPMGAFGILHGTPNEVRAQKLENRLDPLIPFPHKHDFYQLLFVTSGGGWHEIDFKRHPIKARTAFVMRPAQVHSWSLDTNTKGFVIEFDNDEAQTLRRLDRLPDQFQLGTKAWTETIAICERMAREFKDRDEGHETCLRGLLPVLLIGLARATRRESNTLSRKAETQDRTLENFRNLIEVNFSSEHSVEFYAQKLGLSAKALTMRCMRLWGRSAKSLIQERCLLEAKRLLAYSDLSVSELSYQTGFEDPNYFGRYFKKKTGYSPGAFRERARKF